MPVNVRHRLPVVLVENIFSIRCEILDLHSFEEFRDVFSMDSGKGVLEIFPFLERALEELGVHRVVLSKNSVFSGSRYVDNLDKEFAVVPEKIEHREEFLYPCELLLLVYREVSTYGNLVEIFNQPSAVHDISAIQPLMLLFLIIFVAHFHSGTDFQRFPDSSV